MLPRARRHRRHDADGEVLADLVGAGTTYVVARGGRGGLGNAALASARRKAPGFALLGEPGDALRHRPRAQDRRRRGAGRLPERRQVQPGRRACPRPGRRSPTTRSPRWCPTSAWSRPATIRYTVADVPGLIPGASEGKGLGLEFLRHVERCSVLVHVHRLRDARARPRPAHRPRRRSRPSSPAVRRAWTTGRGMVALNKIDVPDGARARRDGRAPTSRRAGLQVFEVSAATHEGLRELSFAMAALVAAGAGAPRRPRRPTRIVLRPSAVDDTGFTVRREETDGPRYVVRGDKPDRWVRQTDFSNDEAVGYLADRLARLGVEEELVEGRARGRRRGRHRRGRPRRCSSTGSRPCEAGAELLHGRRGTDLRLEGR